MPQVYSLRNDFDLSESISHSSLLRFYSNTFSECGQDGILRHIFDQCRIDSGFFVEFGAWDGCHLSNCRALTLRGWKGASIECVPERFSLLQENAPKGVKAINARVGMGMSEGIPLREILTTNGIASEDVTFLSIDIDGLDLEIFESLDFSPQVILVEGGFNYNPLIETKAETAYASHNNQHPLGAVIRSAKNKGYEAVCFFQDTYLVRKDIASPFKEQIKLGANGLYKDAWSFASDTLRDYLVKYREQDKELQEFERLCTGSFHPKPTHFLSNS